MIDEESLNILSNEELMEILASLEAIDSILKSEEIKKGDDNNGEIQ